MTPEPVMILTWNLIGPVTKIDKRIKTASQKFDDEVMSGNSDVIAIFRFMVNWEQSGIQLPDA